MKELISKLSTIEYSIVVISMTIISTVLIWVIMSGFNRD